MDKIKNWLAAEEKDYSEGVQLLRMATRNRTLVNNLARKENNANREKLIYELRKFAGDSETGTEGTSTLDGFWTKVIEVQPNFSPYEVVPPAPVPNFPSGTPDNNKAPDLLDQLVAEMNELYTSRCRLSNLLADLPTEEERERVASAIQEKLTAYNALAEKKKVLEQTGQLPAELEAAAPPQETNDKAELLQIRDRLRVQRSKAKTALEAKPEDVTKQEKYAKIDVELKAIEAKIKLIS